MRSKWWKGAIAVVLAAAAAVPLAPKVPPARAATAAKPTLKSLAGPVLADPADRELYDRLSGQVMSLYDESRGGFVGKDGKPNEAAIELGLARGSEGDTLALSHALRTLRWMHVLLDTVGGGYFEGTRDVDHATAAFEKRTDSNMRRLDLLTRAASRRDEVFVRDARRVVDYCERLLMDVGGGFYSGQGGSRDLEPESNGIALRGWWRWAVYTSDVRRRDFAIKSNDRLWRECRDADLGMVRRDTWGKVREPSLLPDQAQIGLAFLHGWQAAGRDSDLARARVLAAHVKDHFEDLKKGGFRVEYASERLGHSKRGPRPFEDNAVAARFFAELGAATGDTSYTNVARRAWGAFGKQFEKPKIESAEWALAIRATWASRALTRGDWAAKPAKKAAPAKAPAKKPGGGGKRR